MAFDDLIGQYLGRVSSAAEKIGGQVLEVTKVLQEAFNVQRELRGRSSGSQKTKIREREIGRVVLEFLTKEPGHGPCISRSENAMMGRVWSDTAVDRRRRNSSSSSSLERFFEMPRSEIPKWVKTTQSNTHEDPVEISI